MSKGGERKKDVPGAAYMKKIVSFRDTHYERGELYMEYQKRDCTKTSHDKQACLHCDSCQWVGPSMSRIPRPWPDELQLPNFHYKDVFESPNTVGGVSRCIDDWQLRHNIKENFNNGTLKLNDEEAISLFSEKCIVEKELAKDYLHHLTNLERMKNIRADDRLKKQQNRRQKGFQDYDWDTLCRTGEIQKLLLHEIEKYLSHFNLPVLGKKADKVRRVMAHVCSRKGESIDTFVSSQSREGVSDDNTDSDVSNEEESDSENDIVIAHYSTSDSSANDDPNSDPDVSQIETDEVPIIAQLQRQTRSGRNIATPLSRYRNCLFY